MKHLYICVMAGGSGERFWPLSRKNTPKHLLQLLSEKTLLEETLYRVRKIVPLRQILILTNQEQKKAIKKRLPSFPTNQIICEPAKRDTAPACALGTALVRKKDPNAVIAMLASDHLIQDERAFVRNLKEAAAVALKSAAFLTFSIKPIWPSPDLGYLKIGKRISESEFKTKFFRVARFIEKPNSSLAARYIKSKNYGWNSGMFVWSVRSFLSEARRLRPELAQFIENFPAKGWENYVKRKFVSLPKISIDYAMMEKAKNVIAAQAEFGWDDIGYWRALENHLKKDSYGNAIKGKSIAVSSSRNIIFSQKRLVALFGVKDLVVVESDDAILVCHRDHVNHLKKLIPHLPDYVL